jgi:chloramphenicol-sensitive protein RarD
MNKGIWYAVGAYVAWGLFPVYWKWLHQVSALQLLSHRVVWSFLLLLSVFLSHKAVAGLPRRRADLARAVDFLNPMLAAARWRSAVFLWSVTV